MTDERKTHDDRPVYEAPQALRLDGPHTGSGGIAACTAPGSSADGDCSTGAGATIGCVAAGNSAGQLCLSAGNDPFLACDTPGNGFAGRA